jgi:hypothetical protein
MPSTDPNVKTRASRRYRARHPDKIKAANRAHYARHPELAKARERDSRVRRYGRGGLLRQTLLWLQGGKCAGCGSTEPGSKIGWCLDHDHLFGAYRGVLCLQCNSAVGHAKDNPATLLSLAAYIGG